VVVHDLYVHRAAFSPDKAEAKLIVDPNAVLPGAITAQRLQSVTG